MNRHREYCFVNGVLHRRRGGIVDKEGAMLVSKSSP